MREDFHNFTSLDQFDQNRIIKFARLDAIPGFRLLQRQKEYLECYRNILRKNPDLIEAAAIGPNYVYDKEEKVELGEKDQKDVPAQKSKKARSAVRDDSAEE